MPTILTSGSNEKPDYTPHPPGSFLAICCDVFTKEMPNNYKGQKNYRGEIDTNETITKICIAFLTEETIEINGEAKPRYASFWATAKLGTPDYPSNLRKFLQTWDPSLTDDELETFDVDRMIGTGAFLTITNNVGKDGKTYANVAAAMRPPKGSNPPLIPQDFERHEVKEAKKNAEVAQ